MAKLKLKFGGAVFSGEGEPEWLNQMSERFLRKLKEIPIESHTAEAQKYPHSTHSDTFTPSKPVSSLKKHLEDHGGLKSQNQKFLATADWLLKKGAKSVSTSNVTTAIRENQQSRLGNPSDCLNQNVSKGFCEKHGKTFFITPEGYEKLGYK